MILMPGRREVVSSLPRAESICKRSKKRRMNLNDEISQIGSERVCTEAYEGSLGCHTNALYSGL